MKRQKYIAVILSISVAILSFSGCSLEKTDATMESQKYSISLPTEMPSITLAEDDGTIPELESISVVESQTSKESDPTEESKESSSIEGTILPTAESSSEHGENTGSGSSDPEGSSAIGSGENPTAEATPVAGLPTASPTSTPTAQATETPGPTSTPEAGLPTASPSSTTSATPVPQTTQTPQATATPTPTATPTEAPAATQAPQQTEAHVHNWEPRYVASQDYLGNCQFNQHVVVKCYGCGAEEIHDTIAKIHAVTHSDTKVLADVPATCTTDGYRDMYYHDWCDCGEVDEERTSHTETPAYGHYYEKKYTGEVKEDGAGNYLNHWQMICDCGDIQNDGWD